MINIPIKNIDTEELIEFQANLKDIECKVSRDDFLNKLQDKYKKIISFYSIYAYNEK